MQTILDKSTYNLLQYKVEEKKNVPNLSRKKLRGQLLVCWIALASPRFVTYAKSRKCHPNDRLSKFGDHVMLMLLVDA